MPKRPILIQVCLVFFVLLAFGYFAYNTYLNMQARGLSSGFDFLQHPAGFSIIQTLIDYDEASSYARVFLVGLLNTLLVSSMGIFFATILGFCVGIARLSSHPFIGALAAFFIEIVRNIPLLLQIFFWYFAILRQLPAARQSLSLFDAFYLNIRGFYVPAPDLSSFEVFLACFFAIAFFLVFFIPKLSRSKKKLLNASIFVLFLFLLFSFNWSYPTLKGFNFKGGIAIIPEFLALLMALSIYTAAYIAEIVRSGILAVPKGQWEAAASLGLKKRTMMARVILPQAMRLIIPPLTSQYLNLTKNSSLAAAIAYPDLVSVFASTVLNHTGKAVEVIMMTMAVYLTLSLIIAAFMNIYNKKNLQADYKEAS